MGGDRPRMCAESLRHGNVRRQVRRFDGVGGSLMSRWLSACPPLLLLLAFAPACGEEDGGGRMIRPCDRYVDYMCSCHTDDTGFDCSELRAVYEKADAD